MKKSAGLVVIHDNKILLGHPTGSPWYGTYSIPKGEMEEHESALETALRETEEELGVVIDTTTLQRPADRAKGEVRYTDNNGEVYKIVYYFVIILEKPITIDQNKLQKNEIDWAGFLTKEEAEKRIFGRFKPLLKLLK